MKPIFLSILFSICVFDFSQAQNPLVKMWDKRFGGYDIDWFYSLKQSTDAGFILGGFSQSGSDGDKTQPNWGEWDYWIVKTDSLGNWQWDKDYGGNYSDNLITIQQTIDRGYILGGRSNSVISGDKTENSWGSTDYWIIKIDSIGNKLWDKDFGGIDYEEFYSIQQTKDGGYILGGGSNSGIGGDKTGVNWGGSDYWIVKIDSLGNKQWDKDFGGFNNDLLISILQTIDGGYILGGYSRSSIGGDKTEPNWDLTGSTDDYWIVKIESLGNKQWDKDFGGSDFDYFSTILQTSDGGFILGGSSGSGISGDKTQATYGSWDYWIVKTDSLGYKQWDKGFGGTGLEKLYTIFQNTDGGYTISGTSDSPIGGIKTENNLGQSQTWVLKTDSIANIEWDKTIFTWGNDQHGVAIQSDVSCYVIASWSDGAIGGYKTQQALGGTYDYWIVKLCDSTYLPPTASLADSQNVCPNTCIDFINLSFNATSYQWNFPGATPDTSTATNPTNICYPTPGSYSVTLIASNANGSDTLTLQNYITVFPQPPAQSISQSGDTLFAIAGSASYQWYFNGNLISGATDYFYVALSSGDYNVVATDTNGCEVEAVINNVIAQSPLAVGYWLITVYPNPVTSTIDIRGLKNNSADEIKIFNVFGEKAFMAVDWKLSTVNCELFPAGLYYLEISSGEKIYRTKFIKQ